jgi:hypothetical protein
MRCLSGNDTESSATTSLARHSPGPGDRRQHLELGKSAQFLLTW